MASRSESGGSSMAASPFASMGPELFAAGMSEEKQAPIEDEPVLDRDVLEDFGEAGVYEDDADLDPLSAMEKYCRSELPQQRLAYAAGMGAAVDLFQPHEVSGTIVSLLRELLGDVYADVRLTALQQVLPVARRLRSAGTLYQLDLENMWDLVQKLLLDADVENQEVASVVIAELSHEVAKANAVAASHKLVMAVQKLQRLPADLQSEGALASLRLIAEVVGPREGSPLMFATIEEFCVGTFKAMLSSDSSADVRQAVALLLPRFARHMPPALRASLLPGWVKALAADTHWNVRAEVPQLLINLLTPQATQQQQPTAAADSGSNGGSGCALGAGYSEISKWGKVKARAAAPAAGCVADSWATDDLRLICDVADRLCKDTSLQVKVAALASLGQLLPLLPCSLATSQKPPLLAHYVSTAKPQAQLAGVRVPHSLCAPRLSGHLAAMRHRQRQQRRQQQRAAEARDKSYNQAVHELVQEADAIVESELQKAVQEESAADAAAADADAAGSSDAAAAGSSSDAWAASAEAPAASDTGEQQDGASERWLLGTANDTPVGVDDAEGDVPAAAAAAAAAAAVGDAGGGNDAAEGAAAGTSQQQQQKAPPPAPGTAGAELPCTCALHIGRVALHVGPDCRQQLQGAFLDLAVAAVNGDGDVAAALLLAFPDMAAALGHQEAAVILVPVMLELLHTRLDALTPVLSMTLLNSVSALAPELRICLLQTLPSMALQIDRELSGDWRARLAVAQQLAVVAAKVSSAQAAYCLWPLLLSLLKDPVCAVRAAAAAQAGPLLMQLPEQQLPAEQTGAQKAAAASDVLMVGQEQQQEQLLVRASAPAGEAAAAEVGGVGEGAGEGAAEAVEHVLASVFATRAVSTTSSMAGTVSGSSAGSVQPVQRQEGQQGAQQQQQSGQQQQQQGSTGQPLRWVRKGLTSGLFQLQQQVDRVMESPGLQKALNGMDQQLTWLQQHPHSKVLWNIGSKLVRGTSDQSSGGNEAQVTVDDLRQQLTSLQVMESAKMDPCKFLPTPAWHELAGELLLFGSSDSCNDRLVFVIAAGSILSASAQRRQLQAVASLRQQEHQTGGGEIFLQQLLRDLQRLSLDPTPGVRCAVAAAVNMLLSQGTVLKDCAMGPGSSGAESLQDSGTGSTTVSSSTSPSTDLMGGSTGSACSPEGNAPVLQDEQARGCSAGGFSSLTSSGILTVPSTAHDILQDCLQRLQRDPCVSVAEAAKTACGFDGGDSDDAGVAVAAAAAADAAMLANMPAGSTDTAVPAVAEAADLL